MKKIFFLSTILLAPLFLLPYIAYSSPSGTPQKQMIHLRVSSFDPIIDGPPSLRIPTLSELPAEGPYYIVQFNDVVQNIWVQQVEQLGATLLGYIPDHAYIARIPNDTLDSIRTMYAVRWVGVYRPDYKLPSERIEHMHLASTAPLSRELAVTAFPGESPASLAAFFTEMGATIVDSAVWPIGAVFRIHVNIQRIPTIAQNPAISWIEPYEAMQANNDVARQIMNVESVWNWQGQQDRFFGEGQIVAISDSGLDVQEHLSDHTSVKSADFKGRLIKAFPPSIVGQTISECSSKTTFTDLHGHGTHVAGSVLGNGSNSGSNSTAHQYRQSLAGIAPEAKLVFMALNLDGSLRMQCIPENGNYIGLGYQQGARISSNSWGGAGDSSYGFSGATVDSYIWQNKDYLVLYSAGNAANKDRSGNFLPVGQGPREKSIGSPGTAKNVLTVGAIENNRPTVGSSSADNPDEVTPFSSRGPTLDGRYKPDVVAPGTYILSAHGEQAPYRNFLDPLYSNRSYAYMNGTSMATPLTAGAATLVREWLVKEKHMTNPSAAFVKALMIHGAKPLGTPIPNNNSGWGRVDVKNTINGYYTIFDDHQQGLLTGQSISYQIRVRGSTIATTSVQASGQVAKIQRPELATIRDTTGIVIHPVQHQATPPTSTTTSIASTINTIESIVHHQSKANIAPLSNTPQQQPNLATAAGLRPPPHTDSASGTLEKRSADHPSLTSFLLNIINGGDFEDPEMWQMWQIGNGQPVVVDSSNGTVLNGSYSLRLHGQTEDSVWYPISLPDKIDRVNANQLYVEFLLNNVDPENDWLCIAVTDSAGNIFNKIQKCFSNVEPDVHWYYRLVLTPEQIDSLQGETGYVVLYTLSDGLSPHMNAFVDDVQLGIDLPNPTLLSTPSTGSVRTKFLQTGTYYTPYSTVQVYRCNTTTCQDERDSLGTTISDERGEIAYYLTFNASASPGTYTYMTEDVFGRTARTNVTIIADTPPILTITPTSGTPGTRFSVSGQYFAANDSAVAVRINGEYKGIVSSSDQGTLSFTIQTYANVLAGTYTVEAEDSSGRKAEVSFTITNATGEKPSMTASPQSGPVGTTFSFTGKHFLPNQTVNFSLDGQKSIGMLTTDEQGGFLGHLQTTDWSPGSYVLYAFQGSTSVGVNFQVTGQSDGGGGSGESSIYVTLVWTDPPAQISASQMLVNNLNLRIVGPDGKTYYPNNLTGPDTVNNVETIRLNNLAPGTYNVYVDAQSVNTIRGSQPYAIVATTNLNYGTGTSEPMQPGTEPSATVARGDCNIDKSVKSSDFPAIAVEIHDQDGEIASNATKGTYAGSVTGCDANADEKIRVSDILCTSQLIRGQQCGGNTANELTAQAEDEKPALLMAEMQQPVIVWNSGQTSTLRIAAPPANTLQAQQSTFRVNYLVGNQQPFDTFCQTWPEHAKAAFSYAANIWGSLLKSSVPIEIDACWTQMSNKNILGYSGAYGSYAQSSQFPEAPLPNVWYPVSLANALHKADLNPQKADIFIAYNSSVNWYLGTDGAPPANQSDFVSVVLHEIAHGLGFSGSMYMLQNGQGGWGRQQTNALPVIYDTFIQNGNGQKLINTSLFPNPSAALATQLTGGNLFFNGSNANKANNGSPAKIYAPAQWAPGSSIAHLDYETYKKTDHALMLWAIDTGAAIHQPGSITMGILQDLGWNAAEGAPPTQPTVNVDPTAGDPGTTFTFTAKGFASGEHVNMWIIGPSGSREDLASQKANAQGDVVAQYKPTQAGSYTLFIEGQTNKLSANVPFTVNKVAHPTFSLLTIPSNITASSSGTVEVPITFSAQGNKVAGVSFAIAYDPIWLSFDDSDSNGDGIPDAMKINTALTDFSFRFVNVNASQTNGQIAFTIADTESPIAALPDGTLVTLVFKTGTPTTPTEAQVMFSKTTPASLSDAVGRDVPVQTQDGSVNIQVQGIAQPVIGLPKTTSAQPGGAVDIPITFTSNGSYISAIAFSIDYDETVLDFDTVEFHLPSQFHRTIPLSDTKNGLIGIFIGDNQPPISTLSSGTIATIKLKVRLLATNGESSIRFASSPPPSFSTPDGQSIAGSTTNGLIRISTAQSGTLYLPMITRAR